LIPETEPERKSRTSQELLQDQSSGRTSESNLWVSPKSSRWNISHIQFYLMLFCHVWIVFQFILQPMRFFEIYLITAIILNLLLYIQAMKFFSYNLQCMYVFSG